MKKIFTKVIAAIAIAAVAVGSITVFSTKKVQAAEERVISDKNATAHINADGSGYIELNRQFSENDKLTSIAGVPLKEIITFNDGGYIDSYYSKYIADCENLGGGYQQVLFDYVAVVNGRGPKGLFNGAGHLHFTDKSNDTYDLSVWLHAEKEHKVAYSSWGPDIAKISWNS
jgi:hypothetical protein